MHKCKVISSKRKNVKLSNEDRKKIGDISLAMLPEVFHVDNNAPGSNGFMCSASPLMGTATSLSDIERSATSLSDTEARGNKPFS